MSLVWNSGIPRWNLTQKSVMIESFGCRPGSCMECQDSVIPEEEEEWKSVRARFPALERKAVGRELWRLPVV